SSITNGGVLTTTTPGQIAIVAQVLATVPNTRIVFVKRDKHDTALRIFFRKYRNGNHYSYDLSWLMEYLDWYYDLMEIYCKKYPEHTMVVNYEDLVADTENQLRRVAVFAGLELPENPNFSVGDDRGCSKPYRDLMAAAMASGMEKN
ncbi:MAG: sulfotransferase, partial [Alphaproteobacteria bacterium]|nr:sulfotransferase [Alphaproteobacteria bacterium]